MRALFAIIPTLMLVGCSNPGDISDAQYSEYKQLGAPKILYSCTTTSDSNAIKQSIQCLDKTTGECSNSALEKAKTRANVSYVAGVGALTTYNSLLQDAKKECSGTFEVLESKQ
jgi:hypothetical protein